jgi:hypothetical protein
MSARARVVQPSHHLADEGGERCGAKSRFQQRRRPLAADRRYMEAEPIIELAVEKVYRSGRVGFPALNGVAPRHPDPARHRPSLPVTHAAN